MRGGGKVLLIPGSGRVAGDERGLVPVVAQESTTGRVLMLAWTSAVPAPAEMPPMNTRFGSMACATMTSRVICATSDEARPSRPSSTCTE